MSESMEGKVALVTGAAAGIGRATAIAFARRGAKVVVSDIDDEGGEETVRMIREDEGGEAVYVHADVSVAVEVEALVNTVIATWNRIDYAFNNAGIEGRPAPLVDVTELEWDQVIDVNLKSVWLCMKQEIPHMLRQGGGSIVNCASIAGVVGFPGASAYVASKHGMVGLTKTAALDYVTQGVRINAVCPGVIETPMVDRSTGGSQEGIDALVAGTPMGRMGRPEEIAEAVIWLCSDGASFVTGHALVADGGWVMR